MLSYCHCETPERRRGSLRMLGVLNPGIATVFKKKPRNDDY